jgi:two-component system cell cycle sensor histidine kinase/response regulator CckA
MKTLIVDDREEDLYLLETLLKGKGYDVVSASNGAQALEKLRSDNFGLIISDILMPVMDGFQLCREVKSDDDLKDIPLVFYTATYTDEKDEEFALQLGVDEFIRKPTEPDEIIKIIRGLAGDVRKAKVVRRRKPGLEDEKEVLELYSKRLVEKLEKKTLDLGREIDERKKAEEELRGSE